MPTFGTWTDLKMVRRQGDAVSTDEIPDNDSGTKTGLNTLALRSEAEIAELTNKDDWNTSDRAFPVIQELATLMTTVKVLRALYSDDKHLDKMREMNRQIDKTIENIKKGSGLAGNNPAVILATSEYVTKGLYDTTHSDGARPHYLSDY